MARAPRKNKPEAEDFSGYLEKEPTDLQARFTDWLQGDAVGYNPASAKTKADAFAEGVRLATALRMKFQASPENQEVLEERRAAKEEQANAPKPKRRGRKPAKAQEEPEPEEELEDAEELEEDDDAEEEPEEEAPKPRRTRRTTTAKSASASKTTAARPARRTRKAKAASEPAPF